MLFGAIEIASALMFALVIAHALKHYKTDKRKIILVGLTFVYSLIFENINMLLSKGNVGSYFYNPAFHMWVFDTPLFIAFAWSALIYTAMQLSDMLKLKTLVKPFMDALLVIMIDLTLDIVAVRQKLWTWVGLSDIQGWFGVPAENFVGWLFVTFTFSFMFRYFTRSENDMINKATRTEYYILMPVFAYLAMLVMFSLVNLAEDALKLSTSEQLFVFWALVILFAFMLRSPEKTEAHAAKPESSTLFLIIFIRMLFYTYIIWSIMFTKVYTEGYTIILILLLTLSAEILLYHSAFGQVGGQIQFRKKELPHF